LKKVEVVSPEDVKVKPFRLKDFIQTKKNKVGKKALIKLANDLNLVYTEKEIDFSQKIMNAFLGGR
jgi:hypothetical protein